MGNTSLAAAKAAAQDEFYTQLPDIEREMRHYREHFRGKAVYLNCDDPYESNFFKYFAMNFRTLGLKALLSTAYAGSPVSGTQLSLFDDDPGDPAPAFAVEITEIPDLTGDGVTDLLDVEQLLLSDANARWRLAGDGSFDSPEALVLLDRADIVVTNPPYSRFRDFLSLLVDRGKEFVILGPQNAITYRDVFPLIQAGKVWLGGYPGTIEFEVPERAADPRKWGYREDGDGRFFHAMRNLVWYTNLDHARRHEKLLTWKTYAPAEYPTYDNYDAIEVGKVQDIPVDWGGVMGVPITFLPKWNPNQFEVLGITKTWWGDATTHYPTQVQVSPSGRRSEVGKLNDGPALAVPSPPPGKTYYEVGGELFIQIYARILIKRIDS